MPVKDAVVRRAAQNCGMRGARHKVFGSTKKIKICIPGDNNASKRISISPFARARFSPGGPQFRNLGGGGVWQLQNVFACYTIGERSARPCCRWSVVPDQLTACGDLLAVDAQCLDLGPGGGDLLLASISDR